MEKLKTNELSLGLNQTFRNDLVDNFKKIQNGVDGQSDDLNKQITDLLGDVAPQDQNEVTQARIDVHSKPYGTLKSREDATQATAETALSEERDTSVEVQDARTNSSSKTYPTLKERLDNQENDLNNSINEKLATMRLNPEAFANEAALRAKYPQGNDQLNVTTDNGHLWIWINGDFKDCGQFQTAGIDQTLVDQIKKLNQLPELIDSQPLPTHGAVISTIKYLGQDWLQMTSTTNEQYRGLQFIINSPDKILAMANYPVKLHFNIQSSIDQTLGLDIRFYNDSFTDVSDFINVDNIALKASEILNYQKEVLIDSNHIKGATNVVIWLSTSGTSDLGTILINDYSAVLEYNIDRTYDQLLELNQLPELIDSQPLPTNGAVISPAKYLSQGWLQMTSTTSTQYRGLQFRIDNPDKILAMANYPVKLHFNIQSSIDQTLGLDIRFYNDSFTDVSDFINVDNIALKASEILNYQKEVLIDSNHIKGATNVVIWLFTSGTSDLGTVLINDYSAVLEYKNSTSSTSSYDYKQLPEVYLNGPTAGMSGTNYVTMQFKFKDNGREVDGFASTKWQGDSSLAFNKKAYRIKTFEDQNITKAIEFKPRPAWSAGNKYNLKAYYTDPLLCRDVVNANIGTDLWATQKNMPDDLVKTEDFGFINGFPVRMFINNEFSGIYSFNTAKGDYGKNTKAVISGSMYTDATEFRALPTGGVKLDGSDFEMVSPDNPTDEIKQAVNSLITFVLTSSDNDFKTQLGSHIDLESLIDYFIFINVIENIDAAGKNQTLITWDLQKWYFHPYDLDTTYGGDFEGNMKDPLTGLLGFNSQLFTRLNSLFANEIKSRYKELRTWLTPAYVLKMYRDHINSIGESNYEDEFNLWNNPNHDKNTYNFVMIHVYNRFKLLDSLWLQ